MNGKCKCESFTPGKDRTNKPCRFVKWPEVPLCGKADRFHTQPTIRQDESYDWYGGGPYVWDDSDTTS